MIKQIVSKIKKMGYTNQPHEVWMGCEDAREVEVGTVYVIPGGGIGLVATNAHNAQMETLVRYSDNLRNCINDYDASGPGGGRDQLLSGRAYVLSTGDESTTDFLMSDGLLFVAHGKKATGAQRRKLVRRCARVKRNHIKASLEDIFYPDDFND